MKKKFAKYLWFNIENLEKENKALKRLMETRKVSRYGKCFGLLRLIAKDHNFRDDYFGMLMVKNKTMKAFGIKSFKDLSDSHLIKYVEFLVWISSSNSKIDYELFKKWKEDC